MVQDVLGKSVYQCFEQIECGAAIFGKARRLKQILRKLNIDSHKAIYIGDETRDAAAAREAGIIGGRLGNEKYPTSILFYKQPEADRLL
ncbi:hypothetical protein BIY28_18575 [Brenneria goodwinii]|nr:hypothetical protein BIY28_18575 [Brenneria goodwinii]